MVFAENVSNGLQLGARETTHALGKEAGAVAIGAGMVASGVGLTAAVSAAVAQMEYESKRRDLKNLLREELSAATGKSLDKVKSRDIDQLAKSNATVGAHMKKVRKERNIDIGTTFAATMVAIGVVLALGTAFGTGAAPVAVFLAKAALAFGAYSVVKPITHKIGQALFGVEKKTSLERIEEIHREREMGRSVSRERVFAVFVQSSPELADYIKARFGKPFDALPIADKIALTDLIGSKLGVEQITDDINLGRVKATELAFAVEGKISGVLPKAGEAPRHSVLMTIKQKLHDAGEMVMHPLEHQQELNERSFVSRLGRAPMATDMGHVQQLEEARAAGILNQRGA